MIIQLYKPNFKYGLWCRNVKLKKMLQMYRQGSDSRRYRYPVARHGANLLDSLFPSCPMFCCPTLRKGKERYFVKIIRCHPRVNGGSDCYCPSLSVVIICLLLHWWTWRAELKMPTFLILFPSSNLPSYRRYYLWPKFQPKSLSLSLSLFLPFVPTLSFPMFSSQ